MTVKIGNTDIKSLFLGTNELQKIYLGSNLIYQKSVSGDIKFVACPFPTSWIKIPNYTAYNATNDYGEWRISSSNSFIQSAVPKAFDQNESTSYASSKLSDDTAIATIQIDCPDKVKIKPSNFLCIFEYMKSSTIKGLNEDGEWETLNTLGSMGAKAKFNLEQTTEKYFSKFAVEMKRYSSTYRIPYVYEFQITSGTLRKEN